MSKIDLGPGLNISTEEDRVSAIKTVLDGMADVKDSYLAYVRENKERFSKFISIGKSIPPDHFPFLSVIRKWNSYTPVLPAKNGHARGGGYFLYCDGVGIVIDPGYNFVQNFFEQNFKLDDIDVVIITHAHNDHTVELESILSLFFKRNKDISEAEHKKIDLYLNLGTFKKFAGFFDLSHSGYPTYIRDIVLLDSHNEYRVPKGEIETEPQIRMFTTKTQHHEMVTCSYALGFVLQLGGRNIRFTGDTGWNEEIERQNAAFLTSKQIDKIDILILHIGSIEEREFTFNAEKSIAENIENKVFYKHHLGVLGSILMIHKYLPEIVIISEFGEELKSIRKGLTERLSIAMRTPVIPGDIGLHLKVVELSIYCSRTGNFIPYDEIEVHQMDDDLRYISKASFTSGQIIDKSTAIKEGPNLLFRNSG